jgi:hypothetical protein
MVAPGSFTLLLLPFLGDRVDLLGVEEADFGDFDGEPESPVLLRGEGLGGGELEPFMECRRRFW